MKERIHGITLIALVVTILILLILTGITVGLVFSDNGIIAKAKESAEKTNQAVINEQIKMNELANETILDDLDEIIDFETGWDLNKVNKVESIDGTIVPVPKGYTASEVTGENTVKDGFVIYENFSEGDNYEPVTDKSDIETAQETRNQFVWVPVANPNEMYGTDKNGKKWGKLYNFSADGITANNWTESEEGVMSITDKDGYHEPDGEENYLTQLEIDFNNMIASVELYGGFYIGRYETGNLHEVEPCIVKDNDDIGNITWSTIYKKAKRVAVDDNVTTTMIWGCQWDATLRWMYNSGDETKKKYTYEKNTEKKVNNIYNMAGNVTDWTLEKGAYGRIVRGGSATTTYSPASYRYSIDPSGHADYIGCRIVLYI